MKIIGDGGHARVVRSIANHYHLQHLTEYSFVAIGDNANRKREAEKLSGEKFARLFHPSAIVETPDIGEGTVIMAGAIVAAGAKIGRFCIVNHHASVDHDCVIGDYAHIAPGAHLCGHVEVGEGALVGVGVGIAPMCKVPSWTLVKARRLEMEPLYAV